MSTDCFTDEQVPSKYSFRLTLGYLELPDESCYIFCSDNYGCHRLLFLRLTPDGWEVHLRGIYLFLNHSICDRVNPWWIFIKWGSALSIWVNTDWITKSPRASLSCSALPAITLTLSKIVHYLRQLINRSFAPSAPSPPLLSPSLPRQACRLLLSSSHKFWC